MKSIVRYTLPFLLVAFLISSCTKQVIVTPQPSNPVVGTWLLSNSVANDGYKWSYFSTGFETGTFYMYADGSAVYRDNYSSYHGSWFVQNINVAFYDEGGNYYNGRHQSLELQLYEDNNSNPLDLYFDYVSFKNNRFYTTYANKNSIEVYTFDRY